MGTDCSFNTMQTVSSYGSHLKPEPKPAAVFVQPLALIHDPQVRFTVVGSDMGANHEHYAKKHHGCALLLRTESIPIVGNLRRIEANRERIKRQMNVDVMDELFRREGNPCSRAVFRRSAGP